MTEMELLQSLTKFSLLDDPSISDRSEKLKQYLQSSHTAFDFFLLES